MDYQLDKKDMKIIDTICNNARLSYNQIARLTSISKDRVRERILRLQKEMFILSYFPLIDYSKLGLTLFHIYIRLKSIKDLNQNFVDHIIHDDKIVSVMLIMGKYDLELQVVAKSRKEALSELNKINIKDKIKDIDIIQSNNLHIYSMDYGDFDNQNKEIKREDCKKIELDKIDLRLIDLLAKNSRERIIDLAEKLNIGEDSVRYRINVLIKNKIILGFYSRTNKHRRSLMTYIALIKTKRELEPSCISKFLKIKNLFYLKKVNGKWNYLIRFHSGDNKNLIDLITELRNILGDNLTNLEFLHILNRKKFLPYNFSSLKN